MCSGHGHLGPGRLVKTNEGLLVLLSPRKWCATVCFQNARSSWTFAEEDGWCALNHNTYFQQICKGCFFHLAVERNVSSVLSLMYFFSLAVSYYSSQQYKFQVLENNYAEQYKTARNFFLLLVPS